MKHNLNDNKKNNNSIVTASSIFTLAFFVVAAGAITTIIGPTTTIQSAEAFTVRDLDFKSEKAPIVTSGENIYIAWWGNRTGGNDEVSFTRTTDNGVTFQDAINLSNSPNGISFDVTMAAADNNVYVTFIDNKTGFNQIYLTASNDNGTTFGQPILINEEVPPDSNQTYNEFGMPIADETGLVKLVDDHSTRIAASGNNVYIVWYDYEIADNWDVYFRASNDGGKTFGEIINISNTTDRVSHQPEIAADGNNVYVTYWDDMPLDKKAFTRISTDAGQTFGTPIQLRAPTPMAAANATSTTITSAPVLE
jgi:hypothetical protein